MACFPERVIFLPKPVDYCFSYEDLDLPTNGSWEDIRSVVKEKLIAMDVSVESFQLRKEGEKIGVILQIADVQDL